MPAAGSLPSTPPLSSVLRDAASSEAASQSIDTFPGREVKTMSRTEIKRSEDRNEVAIECDGNAVRFEVVQQIEEVRFDGQLAFRRVISTSVEGDIPMTLKASIANGFETRQYHFAAAKVCEYLRGVPSQAAA